MAVVRAITLEELVPPAILDFQSFVIMSEGPDFVTVPGHIPNTWEPDNPPPQPPPTNLIPQMNIQQDQSLQFTFWTWQSGYLTQIPNMPFNLRYQILFELLGPGEAAGTTLNGTEAFFGGPSGPGHVYTQTLTKGGGGTPALDEGSYRVYARFGFGANNLPHTPMAGMAEIGFLNVYRF